MSGTGPNTSRRWWSHLVARVGQLRRRPLLVNLRTLLDRIPFKPLDINCLYFLEYAGLPPQHANFLRGRAEVRSASRQDLEGLTACQDTPGAFRKRFESNDHCAVAVLDGRVVGYQWFCSRSVYVEERYSYEIEVPPDAIYEYDIFIRPEHRLAGLWFKFHCVYLNELMQALQRQRIIGMVDYGNRLSMNTHLRFGFRLVRAVVVMKLFGKAFVLRRTGDGERIAVPGWVSVGDTGSVLAAPPPQASRPGPVRPEPAIPANVPWAT
ncbi:MAG TPA: hypothetical protein VGN09_26665 [Vicinamibacteria bacterium]|jgi:GNAT superfamily N-acetyltransferase